MLGVGDGRDGRPPLARAREPAEHGVVVGLVEKDDRDAVRRRRAGRWVGDAVQRRVPAPAGPVGRGTFPFSCAWAERLSAKSIAQSVKLTALLLMSYSPSLSLSSCLLFSILDPLSSIIGFPVSVSVLVCLSPI